MSSAQRQSERIGVALRDPLPWHDFVQVVGTAEESGYEALFVPEIAGREAFSTLAGVAGATERLRMGTGVVAIPTRSLPTMAMAAATVQELSGGRFILGVGAGPPGPGSLDRVRRHVGALRAALSGRAVDEAEVPGFRLSLSLTQPPPIWLAALGDRMVGLAGEVGDGILLNWCTPERVAAARRLMAASAERSGRDPAKVTVAVYVRACLGLEEPVAMLALKRMAGRYAAIPHYHRQFDEMGLGEEAALAAKAHQGGRPEDVPDELVRAVCVTGGRREALRRFAEYRRAGADLVLCYPVPALDPFSSLLGTVLGAAPSPSLES